MQSKCIKSLMRLAAITKADKNYYNCYNAHMTASLAANPSCSWLLACLLASAEDHA